MTSEYQSETLAQLFQVLRRHGIEITQSLAGEINVILFRAADKAYADAVSHAQLTVKELAGALRVSVRFVYAMRQCGFKMHGRQRKNQTASSVEALSWIERTNFKMKDGNGKCKNSANLKS